MKKLSLRDFQKKSLFILFGILMNFQASAQFNILGQSNQAGPVSIQFGAYLPMNYMVDSLNCTVMAPMQYEIAIQNSTAADTLFVVYNNYSQMDNYVNANGSNFYQMSFTPGPISGLLFSMGISDMNGNMLFWHQINKIICGGDTLFVDNLFAYDNYPLPCTFSSVSGKVFLDNNGDCSYNSGDGQIAGVGVSSVNQYNNGVTNQSYPTNVNGDFSSNYFRSNGLISSVFSVPSLYNFAFSIPSCSSPTVTITSLPAAGIDFPRNCAADIDLAVWGPNSWVRPLIPFHFQPSARNIGCSPVSGVLKLVLDPNVTYNATNSSNPADYVIGDTLFWNYTNLTNVGTGSGFWNSFNGGIELTPSNAVNIGDTIHLQIITHVPSNDADISNNTHWCHLPVVNSYDPNIKTVLPQGEGPDGNIPLNTSKLTYTVHFQNTGNAPALNVFILDTLQATVIPNTLRIIDASHTMNPDWLSSSVVKFSFPNINLLDSTTNEPLSHGFVTFEIDLVSNQSEGTQILNTAHIFFDNNPAIVTNTAKNTLHIDLTSLKEESLKMEVSVAPNPMSNTATISITNANMSDYTFILTDLSGKMVKTIGNIESQSFELERGNLKNGIYLYQIVRTDGQTANGRIVLQ